MKKWDNLFVKLVYVYFICCLNFAYAQLSPDMIKYFFKWNHITWKNDSRPKAEWNLQYLVWPTAVWNYLNLSEKDQNFVKEIANIILTDKYAKNIEKESRVNWDNYISLWKIDTFDLSDYLERVVNILYSIQRCEKWLEKPYNQLLKDLNDVKNLKNINILINKLKTLKPKVEAVKRLHEMLKEKQLQDEKNYRKKETALLKEIRRIDAKIKKQNAQIKEKDKLIKKDEERFKRKREELRKLNEYLKTLKRFRRIVWISQ